MNREVKKYIRDCKVLLPYCSKNEKNYLNRLGETIASEMEDAAYDMIVERFGTPKDIVVEYYNQQSIDELLRKSRLVHIIKRCIVFMMAVIIAFLAYKAVIYQITYEEIKNSSNGYFEEVIE